METADGLCCPFCMPAPGLAGVRLALCRIERSEERYGRCERERQAVLRLLEYFGFRESDYCHNAVGAPYINGSEFYISVSHSLDYAAVAVSERPGIGVDVEQSRPAQLQRVATRFLSESERAVFTTPGQLLRAWAVKEAVYKAAGIPGLSGPEIIIDIDSGEFATVGDRSFLLSTRHTDDYCCVVALETSYV